MKSKLTFRQLLKEGFGGKPALMADWADHLSTLFPEVRIKKVLEIRSADCASLPLTGALVALFRGLLYDDQALTQGLELVPFVSFETHLSFMDVARRKGLAGTHQKRPLWEWAKELVGIAREGLKRVDLGDVQLLEPLFAQVESKESPSAMVERSYQQGLPPQAWLPKFAL
jgi:glutamate--cysteine ligase